MGTFLRAIGHRLVRAKARSFRACKHQFRGRKGLEIGGPSSIFSKGGIFPVYQIIESLDNCCFSSNTVWATAEEGLTFQFDKQRRPGRQYVAEAIDLSILPTASYDFILSSHTLEHTANPILALSEWMRVLKDLGLLVIILPHKAGTFDHRRPLTSLEHLIDDFGRGTKEDDLTHLPEVLALHDLEMDPPAGDLEAFTARSMRNFENRCLHHHVFDVPRAVELISYMNLQIKAVELLPPFHILVVAQKLRPAQQAQNQSFIARAAEYQFKFAPNSKPLPENHSAPNASASGIGDEA